MCTNPSTADPILSAIPGTQVLDPASTTLLASPIAIAIVHTGLRLLVYLSHIQLVQRSRRLPIFPAFVCVLLWWRRRRALRHRRRIAKRMAYKRRMTRLTLMQDWYFLAAMLNVAAEVTQTRRTIWTKLRSQSFFVECIKNWEDEWKRNFCVSRATFQFLSLELRPYLQRSVV